MHNHHDITVQAEKGGPAMILLKLFITFFLIGLFNFGGGNAMISLIQTQVVNVQGWIEESQFTDIVAISQMTPGPIGINCATYVGYEVCGVAGSAVATFAVVLPSFLIFFLLVKLFDRFQDHPVFKNVMSVLKPAVTGLIGAAGLILAVRVCHEAGAAHLSIISENFPDWKAWTLFGAAFAASMWTKASPILILVAAGILGFLIY